MDVIIEKWGVIRSLGTTPISDTKALEVQRPFSEQLSQFQGILELLELLAWPPLQSLAVKKNFCADFGRWKTFNIWWKMGGETFLVRLRGAKKFSIAFQIVFRILFRVFQTVFRIDLKLFGGKFKFVLHACRPKELHSRPILRKPKSWSNPRNIRSSSRSVFPQNWGGPRAPDWSLWEKFDHAWILMVNLKALSYLFCLVAHNSTKVFVVFLFSHK